MNWKAAGPKLFFPNIVFTMIRSGKSRPANQVTFRVPLHLNKLDIKAYLEGLYNVPVAQVETTIFLPRTDSRTGRHKQPTKKNAVVTLGEGHTFEFPDPPPPEKLIYPLDRTQNFQVMRKK